MIQAVLDQIKKVLQQGEKVQLLGLETSEVQERAERNGRNTKSRETMTIPPSKVPDFKTGKELKYVVK
ncbi:HU family DNA-binding protein [Bacillus toyonensis]|uniref:HU family DNA-binding protein n=1 Tax=Bacillus toyonensis TaxID=155322 RepID=UPI003B005F97